VNPAEEQFTREVAEAIRQCDLLGYHPTRARQMMAVYGALGMVKRLLHADTTAAQSGFARLWEMDKLELSFEAIALRHQALFTADERRVCRYRMNLYVKGARE
jgi:hypothetical protein